MIRLICLTLAVLSATSEAAGGGRRKPAGKVPATSSKKEEAVPEPPPPAATAPASAPKPSWSLAVLDLADRGVGAALSQLISETLVQEAHKLDGPKVSGSSEIRTLMSLERQKELLGCSETYCMSEIAGALGTDKVLAGSVGRVGESWVISLQVLNSRTGQVEANASERVVGGSGEAFLDVIGPMMAKLFPDVPLKTGETRGAPPSQLARASQLRVGGVDRRFAYGMAGAAVLFAGAGAVTAVLSKNAEGNYQRILQDSLSSPQSYSQLQHEADRAKQMALVADVAFGVAGVAAVTSVILYAFSGSAPEPAKSVEVHSSLAPVPGGAQWVVSGGF